MKNPGRVEDHIGAAPFSAVSRLCHAVLSGGGEKAMAMYIPLFASVCAKYDSAKADCLRIISLDEAFAGVDDNNIRDMFRILTELDLEYVLNSQVLWGEYDTVPSLSISEFISDVNKKVVSIVRYNWNGKKRELIM